MENKELREVKIIENNKIEGTPFNAVKTSENNKYYIVCGKTRMLTDYEKLEEVIKHYKKPTFENITFLIESVINYIKQN